MDQVGANQMQHQLTQDAVGLSVGLDRQLMMLRHETREKISEYLGRTPNAANWHRRLPDLVRRLEEILFRNNPNKRDYANMAKGPIEPHLMFALQICSDQQFQQNQQLSRQIASSRGYGMMTMTPGITQGGIENSGMSYVPYNMGSSSGAGLVPQSANMGTSLPVTGEGPDEHVNTQLTLGMNPTHHNIVDTLGTNRILQPKVTPPPTTTVKEVAKKPKFRCPICIDEIVDAASTVCGHVFCQKCIRTSIQTQRKCPTCRTKLNLRNIHRVYLPTTGLN